MESFGLQVFAFKRLRFGQVFWYRMLPVTVLEQTFTANTSVLANCDRFRDLYQDDVSFQIQVIEEKEKSAIDLFSCDSYTRYFSITKHSQVS